MTKKNIIIFVVLPLIFLAIINYHLAKSLRQHRTPTPTGVTNQSANLKDNIPATEKIQPPRQKHKLVPDNPAEYGIVSIPKSDLPHDQDGWNSHMKKSLADSKLLETEKGKEVIEKMKTSDEEFQDTMKKVNERITVYEQKVSEDHLDRDSDERLQRLYQLKSIGTILKEKGVTLQELQENK